ncbi:MAG: ABC transporter substrate-binding protein [Candidatus Wallacebacter cryptica]
MKVRNVAWVITALLLVILSGISAAGDYEPPPGVLSPDQVDFGGKTVTIIRGALPADEERVAEAEQLFNVKFDTIRLESADQIMARIMAGDSAYDIIRAPHREGYFALVSSGMLLPADDYLPEEFFESLPNTDRYVIEKLKYEGKRYGIGVHHGVVNDTMMIMSYNKDLLEQYGLEDPYELYLNDEWTYDVLEEYAIILTQDTDGDGIIDQRGITDVANYAGFIRFAPSNGAELAVQEDGRWVFAYNRENAIEAFNTILRWRELGIMGDGDYNAGKVGFVVHTHLGGNRHAQAAGINFGLVPMPKGPHVDRYHYPAFNFTMMFLPVNAEYPEGLIALANFLYREEDTIATLDQMVSDWMTTQEHYRMYVTATESWQGEGDIFQGTDLWEILRTPITEVLAGEKGAAAAMDEIANQAQAYLDDLFNQ